MPDADGNMTEAEVQKQTEEVVVECREELEAARERLANSAEGILNLQDSLHDSKEQVIIGQAASVLVHAAHLDVTNPHGLETPARFVRMLKELTTPEEFKFTTFPAESDNMVMLKNIPFASVCSHHVIPFVGYAHIAYVPDGRLAGLSKFARLVKFHSRKLQVQENLTADVALSIEEHLRPKGVAVIMEAEHLCMTIRGAQSPGTQTRTAEMRGVFADHNRTAKAEFLSYVNGGK